MCSVGQKKHFWHLHWNLHPPLPPHCLCSGISSDIFSRLLICGEVVLLPPCFCFLEKCALDRFLICIQRQYIVKPLTMHLCNVYISNWLHTWPPVQWITCFSFSPYKTGTIPWVFFFCSGLLDGLVPVSLPWSTTNYTLCHNREVPLVLNVSFYQNHCKMRARIYNVSHWCKYFCACRKKGNKFPCCLCACQQQCLLMETVQQ